MGGHWEGNERYQRNRGRRVNENICLNVKGDDHTCIKKKKHIEKLKQDIGIVMNCTMYTSYYLSIILLNVLTVICNQVLVHSGL